jgi:hypothetical protein
VGPRAGLDVAEKRKVLYCRAVYDSFQKFGNRKQTWTGGRRLLGTGSPHSGFLIFNPSVKKGSNYIVFAATLMVQRSPMLIASPSLTTSGRF